MYGCSWSLFFSFFICFLFFLVFLASTRASGGRRPTGGDAMEECPHLKSSRHPILSKRTQAAIKSPQEWLCNVCGTTESIYACLHCPNFSCGRFNAGHALEHSRRTRHPLVLEITHKHVYWFAARPRARRAGQIKKK